MSCCTRPYSKHCFSRSRPRICFYFTLHRGPILVVWTSLYWDDQDFRIISFVTFGTSLNITLSKISESLRSRSFTCFIAERLGLSVRENQNLSSWQWWCCGSIIIVSGGSTGTSYAIMESRWWSHNPLEMMRQRLTGYNKGLTLECHLLFNHYCDGSEDAHPKTRFLKSRWGFKMSDCNW